MDNKKNKSEWIIPMSKRIKRDVLFLLLLSVVAIMLISSSLSEMELKPGSPFPGADHPENSNEPVWNLGPIKVYELPLLLQGIFGLACIIYLLYSIINLFKLMDWKWIFHPRILLLVLLIVGYLLISIFFSRFVPESEISGVLSNAPTVSYPVAPIGAPPKLFIWLVIFILILAIGFFALWLFRHQQDRPLISDPVLQEAEIALKALKRGEDIKNVILYYYFRMSQALQEEQGIIRGKSMTTREFEELLQAKGLPIAPVRQITSLFESVRYGNVIPAKKDEQKGIDSLNEIILCIKGRKDQTDE